MNKFYKRFLLLVLLVLGISGIVIYTTVDIYTLRNLTKFHSWSLVLAVFAVSLGMFFDGSRLMHLVKISNERITLYQAVQVIFGNYFLALLTPGATGGAVAQLMFLRHAGVPTGKAAVLVIVRTLSSIFFLVLCMPFIFMHDAGIVPGISNEVLMAITLTAFAVIVGIVWGSKKGYLDYTVMGRMIFLNMLLYFTPTPGGSGVAEGGFVLLFADTVPSGTVGIIAVCWRLVAEYIPFFIGFYYTITVFGRDFLNRHLGHAEQ